MSAPETIVWQDIAITGAPGNARTVLAYVERDNYRPRVFFAWHGAGACWHEHGGDRLKGHVTHWAELPAGPVAQACREGGAA